MKEGHLTEGDRRPHEHGPGNLPAADDKNKRVDRVRHGIRIRAKNKMVQNLKYSINHATKAYNDAIRVYEAKLVEFGIPPEELGFQPLETHTSSMPAGLVSS